jgi:hypothetical protein
MLAAATTTTQTPTLLLVPSVIGGIAALLVVASAVRARWRETLGRRADRYARLARLGTGAHLSFFVAVLGEPPAMRSSTVKPDYVEWIGSEDPDFDPSSQESQTRLTSRRFEVSTFIDRDYYVQTISDHEETVLAFSVTTRSARFRPIYQAHRPLGPLERWRWRRQWGEPYRPLVNIKLGRTTFADLDPRDPDQFAGPHFRISIGAHNHAYSEMTYMGNPGGYQSFVWTASDAARQGRFGFGIPVAQEVGADEWPDPSGEATQPQWNDMVETQRFRRETVITTYTVIHGSLALENYPLARFGPHENEVRLLP